MAWYDEAIFYHIYPLGMLDAPKENSYGEPVHRLPELYPWLDHIKGIGCNAIYIGPLFESVGHGYETTDYRKLDSRLGDNQDLKDFVKKCHDMGIRVIFDGVFNHVGRDFFAFRDLKENRENSRYKDWFCDVWFGGNNEYNDDFSYGNWGGYNLLVKLNQRNPEVRDYICDVIRFWVKEFDVDGIRLDAADVLDFDFMKALRQVAHEVKPEFWLMGEVIHGDYTRWVNDGTLHSVTNYTLHKALYSGHNEHNYFEIAHTIKRLNDMSGNNLNGFRLYNFSDNHDVERIITKLNNKANYVPVHVMVYTLPGIPSVYYGSEFGIEGRKERGSDASLRPALKYEDYKNALEDNPCTKIIARLGAVRQANPVLSYGEYREVMLTNRQYVYSRACGDEMAVITLNNDEQPAEVRGNGLKDGDYIGALTGERMTVSGGWFSTVIGPNTGEIWIRANENEQVEKLVTEDVNPVEPEIEIVETEAAKPEVVKLEPVEIAEVKTSEPELTEPKDPEVYPEQAVRTGAGEKYGLSDKYDTINAEEIRSRQDYENMSIEELQVAILEKMAANGPVNDQMVRTVMENVYPDSLRNWVKSFR